MERAFASLHVNRTVLEPAGAVHEMPYPCYMRDSFLFYLSTVMPLCVTLGWVCGVTLQVLQLVQERQDRLREVSRGGGGAGREGRDGTGAAGGRRQEGIIVIEYRH